MWAWGQDEFNSTYALNDTAAFFTVIAFLELLDAGNKNGNRAGIHSQVLITASVAGLMRKLNSGIAYQSSKAAALHLAKVLSTYFAPHGIRVNALAPGIFPSESIVRESKSERPRLTNSGSGEMTAGHVGASAGFSVQGLPAGRTGSEEDMAGTILYLASRAGAYISGMVLLIDGGRLSVLPATY